MSKAPSMGRPFVGDLGPSPFKHTRRQKALAAAAASSNGDQDKDRHHDLPKLVEQLAITPPVQRIASDDKSVPSNSNLRLEPRTNGPTFHQDSPARNVPLEDGKNLSLVLFKARSRLDGSGDEAPGRRAFVHAGLGHLFPDIESGVELQSSLHAAPGKAPRTNVMKPRNSLRSGRARAPPYTRREMKAPPFLRTNPKGIDPVAPKKAEPQIPRRTKTLLEILVNRRLPPFLSTGLGKIPPEVREIIWKYVLTNPILHGTRVFSQSVPTNDDLVVTQPWDPSFTKSATSMTAASTTPTLSLPGISCPAILRTCRLIYQEAQYVLYSNTSFHLTNASALLLFLKTIGPGHRNELRSLHVGGLLGRKRSYTEEEIDTFCREEGFDGASRDYLARCTDECVLPDADEAAKLLGASKSPIKIILHLKVGEELLYIMFLAACLWCPWYVRVAIDLVDEHHWAMRAARSDEENALSSKKMKELDRQACPPGSSWGDDTWGTDRTVEVKLVRNEETRDGPDSWSESEDSDSDC